MSLCCHFNQLTVHSVWDLMQIKMSLLSENKYSQSTYAGPPYMLFLSLSPRSLSCPMYTPAGPHPVDMLV